MTTSLGKSSCDSASVTQLLNVVQPSSSGLHMFVAPKQDQQSKLVSLLMSKVTASDASNTKALQESQATKGMDSFNCAECNKTYISILEFLEHKAEHGASRGQYQCELCQKQEESIISLVTHYQQHHRLRTYGPHLTKVTRARKNKRLSTAVDILEIDTQHVVHEPINKEAALLNISNAHISEYEKVNHDKIIKNSSFVKTIVPNTDKNDVFHSISSTDNINATSSRVCTRSDPHDFPETVNDRAGVNSGENEINCHLAVTTEEVLSDTSVKGTTEADFNFVLEKEGGKTGNIAYGKMIIRCLHCEYKTLGIRGLKNHMHREHGDLLEVNLSMHPQPKLISQDLTEPHVVSLSEYHQYLQEKIETKKTVSARGKPQICTVCGKSFNQLRNLRRHLGAHRLDKRFLCDHCGKGFKTGSSLLSHRRTHNKKGFQCSQCDFSSSVNAAIHAHRQLHSGGSVLCDICGFAYCDRQSLTKHMRVHDGNRPFACSYPGCTWRFKTEFMCKAHIRSHTSENKFLCKVCGFFFRHKHHLRRHERQIHGIDNSQQTKANSTITPGNTIDPSAHLVTPNGETAQDEPAATVYLVIDSDKATPTLDIEKPSLVIDTNTDGTQLMYSASEMSAINLPLIHTSQLQATEEQL